MTMNKSRTNLLIAKRVFGWDYKNWGDGKMFVPPMTSPMINWAAHWSPDGFPDWLPDFENSSHIVWIEELGLNVKVTVEILGKGEKSDVIVKLLNITSNKLDNSIEEECIA